MLIDKFGRTVDYIRISVTDRCNYRCKYCMPENGIKLINHKDILSYEEIVRIVTAFAKRGIKRIRITGGEPLVRSNIEWLVGMLGTIDGIENISITTNGSLLKEKAFSLKANGLTSVTVSLDTLDKDKFEVLTRIGNIDDVTSGIDEALKTGLTIKINTVFLKGVNEDKIMDILNFAFGRKIIIRFIELMPTNVDQKFFNKRFAPLSIVKDFIKRNYNIKDSDYKSAGPASYININGNIVGFISAISTGFCEQCNRIRLSSSGIVYPCLGHMSRYAIDFKAALRTGKPIDNLIDKVIEIKPKSHDFESLSIASMSRIGG